VAQEDEDHGPVGPQVAQAVPDTVRVRQRHLLESPDVHARQGSGRFAATLPALPHETVIVPLVPWIDPVFLSVAVTVWPPVVTSVTPLENVWTPASPPVKV